MQKGLSRERPGYRAVRVESTIEMVQIVCRGGVVWGLTADRTIVVRLGIDSMKEEGSDWAYLKEWVTRFIDRV
jgi:Propeller